MSQEKIIYCADAIALYEDTKKLVIIERLGNIPGLALPGGKQESGETLSYTVVREMLEETGLSFEYSDVLGAYGEPGRDPRGKYISVVFIGTARGVVRDESAKTRVHLFGLDELGVMLDRFVFDHGKILSDFMTSNLYKK